MHDMRGLYYKNIKPYCRNRTRERAIQYRQISNFSSGYLDPKSNDQPS